MKPVVIFPDVEMWAVTYLGRQLFDHFGQKVFVGNVLPKDTRDHMVTVRRDGGPRLDATREVARLGVNVWSTSEQSATDLARLVAALLYAAPDGAPVLNVRQMSGPSPVVDKQPRRYLTFEIAVRGTDLT